jgi:PIN domain nuclease of toxin-antitoxin system
LSPISVWELLLLVEKRRVKLKHEPQKWVDESWSRLPLREAPINRKVALRSRTVRTPNQDPAERFLAATAVVYDLTLVTADENLLRGKGYKLLAIDDPSIARSPRAQHFHARVGGAPAPAANGNVSNRTVAATRFRRYTRQMLRLAVRWALGCMLISPQWLAGCDDVAATRADAGQNANASLTMDADDAAMIDGDDATRPDAGADASVGTTVVHATDDMDCDGTPNGCFTQTHDRFGNIMIRRYDDCKGGLLSCYSSSFDAAGHLLASGKDDDCDGIPDHPCFRRSYDSEGREIHVEGPIFDEMDCDPPLGRCVTYTRDVAENITLSEVDGACDGDVDQCVLTQVDSMGNVSRIEYDDACDGSPETCRITERDSAGNATLEASDTDCDGTPDAFCDVRIYDMANHETSRYRDDECDGVPNSDCDRSTFDASGNRTELFSDYTCNGVAEQIFTSVFDANGNEISTTHDLSGGVACTIDSTYDAQGRVISQRYTGCDYRIGSSETKCQVTTYSDDGLQRTLGDDADCDGVADSNCFATGVEQFALNVDSYRDDDCDGVPDRSCTFVVDP